MNRLPVALLLVGCASSAPRPVEPAPRPEPATSPASDGTTLPRPERKPGRWEAKRRRILEQIQNAPPPPEKTALKTRAHPFALYLVQVHGALHDRWASGFLADLDEKPPSHPLNDRRLTATVELVITAEGKLARPPILVRTSGLAAFDTAAVEIFVVAAPFAAPPSEIRSHDGKVYVRWTLFRDERQCSPSFADPIILDAP